MNVHNSIVDRPSQNNVNMGRVWGMYQLPNKQGYRNARIGGFKNLDAAVRAIAKRSGVGYIMRQDHMVIHAVRNGRIVSIG